MTPRQVNSEIVFEVNGLPPGKNEAKSLLAAGHRHAERVASLLAAARVAAGPVFKPWSERVGLELVVCGEPDGDAPNYLGGVGDVLQQARRNLPSDAGVYLFRDDSQIREIHYRQEPSDSPHYRVRLWKLPTTRP